MRLLHTSDWHLGHRLHGVTREREHARFLRWLALRCEEEAADALVIAGDVFDTANPPAEAQRAFYRFIAECLFRCPKMDIVVIGGNHDSPARLDAAADVLRPLNVHILGGLPRDGEGAIDNASTLVPLRKKGGPVAAWLVAVPYLRPTDWPRFSTGSADGEIDEAAAGSKLLPVLRGLYAELFSAARKKKKSGQALIAAGHCLLAGGALSEGSERRIQLGNSMPLPSELFPDDFAYVALGHLHRAQRVGERGHIRYSGSPLPLAFSERTYPHQIVRIDLEGESLLDVQPILVPRTREVLSIPEKPQPLDEVLKLLKALPRALEKDEDDEPPFLEVRVRVDPATPQPLLRPAIEEALNGAHARLLRIACERPAAALGDAISSSETPLLDLHPEEVFSRLYQRVFCDANAKVPAAQLALFRRLIESVEGAADSGAAP